MLPAPLLRPLCLSAVGLHPGCGGNPLCWGHAWLLVCSPSGNSQPWLLLDTATHSVPCSRMSTMVKRLFLALAANTFILALFHQWQGTANTVLWLRYSSLAPVHLSISSHLLLSPFPVSPSHLLCLVEIAFFPTIAKSCDLFMIICCLMTDLNMLNFECIFKR